MTALAARPMAGEPAGDPRLSLISAPRLRQMQISEFAGWLRTQTNRPGCAHARYADITKVPPDRRMITGQARQGVRVTPKLWGISRPSLHRRSPPVSP